MSKEDNRFFELIKREEDTFKKKNHDYADQSKDIYSNFKECERFGIPAAFGCLVRMTDKDCRKWETVLKGNKVSDETITDTAMDDSVYNKIFVILWNEFKENPNSDKIIEHLSEVKKLLHDKKSD